MHNFLLTDVADAAIISQTAAERLLQQLDWMTLQPQQILDVDCRTGLHSQLLHARYPHAQIIACDPDSAFLHYAEVHHPRVARRIKAPAFALPVKDQSIDLVFANMSLPWIQNVAATLEEWRRVLRPEGVVILSSLGPDTLQELAPGITCIPQRVDMHDIGDALLRAGFTDPVLTTEYIQLAYEDPEKCLQELTLTEMIKPLQSGQSIHDVLNQASAPFTVTYEIILGHAFAPSHAPGFNMEKSGEVKIPLSVLRKELARKK